MTFYESRTRFRILLRKYNPKNTVKMIRIVDQKKNNLLQWHIYSLPLSFTINIKVNAYNFNPLDRVYHSKPL